MTFVDNVAVICSDVNSARPGNMTRACLILITINIKTASWPAREPDSPFYLLPPLLLLLLMTVVAIMIINAAPICSTLCVEIALH